MGQVADLRAQAREQGFPYEGSEAKAKIPPGELEALEQIARGRTPVVAAVDGAPTAGRARRVIRQLEKYQSSLGTRLLAMAEQAYDQALRQAGVRIEGRSRSRLGKTRQAAVCEAIERRDPMRAWLSVVGITELELLRGAFDSFAEKAREEFERYEERARKAIAAVGLDADTYLADTNIDDAVDLMVVGLTAMARRRLLIGEEAMTAAALPRIVGRPRARVIPGAFDIPGLPNPLDLARAAARLVRYALQVHEQRSSYRSPPTPDDLPFVSETSTLSFIENVAEGIQHLARARIEIVVEPPEGEAARQRFIERKPPPLKWEWRHGFYGEPRVPFDVHADILDGEVFLDRVNDARLVNDKAWPDGDRYKPGDHDGCTCEWVLVPPD